MKKEQLLNSIVDENTTIYKRESMIYYIGFNRVIEDLTWNKSDYDDYLTLKEIKEQVKFPVRVISDLGLEGFIYEYGNYDDGKWRLYGITKGYA
jgi:hypothetical protein